jgi:anti-anti-sigma factor
MQPGELTVQPHLADGTHTLKLDGELDLATAAELEGAVAEVCADGAEEVVLDLSGLVFVDSAGLRAILASRSVCEGHGCRFALMHAQEPVERLFGLTGLTQKLPLTRSASHDRDGAA